MDLALSDDQSAVLTAIEGLSKPFAPVPSNHRGFDLYSADLDSALEAGGFLDVAAADELGPVTAALLVEQIARLPVSAEIGASALVRPILCPDLPRPLALAEARQPTRPVRFLPQARTALVIDGESVHAIAIDAGMVAQTDSLFAYPMGRLTENRLLDRRGTRCAFSADDLRSWWRIALAAEIAGLMKAALDSTVDHVSSREQFGRPLGAFQAVRHRLAEASVRTTGVRSLALKAAFTRTPADAALAAFHAQDAATGVVYDLHQFLGAMGITLEHPLHLWTYRLRALLSELGGRGAQAEAAAALAPAWNEGTA
jgi:hypothetical protein